MSYPILTSIAEQYDAKLLRKQRALFSHSLPLKGLKVLFNAHLFENTFTQLLPLLDSGAEVTVTLSNELSSLGDTKLIQTLIDDNVRFTPFQNLKNEFDLAIDVIGGFSRSEIKPKKGVVELTKSGIALYEEAQKNGHLSFPVIDVDSTNVKQLETSLGTGESLIRILDQCGYQSLHKKTVLIFGFGKVGSGIAFQIKKNGAIPIIVEVNKEKHYEAIQNGFESILMNNEMLPLILEKCKTSFAIVTATGVKDFFERHFSLKDIPLNTLLINMGAETEFGSTFSSHPNLLNNGLSANFMLKNPTLMKYLDPSLFLQNLSLVQLAQSKPLQPGVYKIPQKLDASIVALWKETYNESIPTHK
jgi:adenosylhomocysteinase